MPSQRPPSCSGALRRTSRHWPSLLLVLCGWAQHGRSCDGLAPACVKECCGFDAELTSSSCWLRGSIRLCCWNPLMLPEPIKPRLPRRPGIWSSARRQGADETDRMHAHHRSGFGSAWYKLKPDAPPSARSQACGGASASVEHSDQSVTVTMRTRFCGASACSGTREPWRADHPDRSSDTRTHQESPTIILREQHSATVPQPI